MWADQSAFVSLIAENFQSPQAETDKQAVVYKSVFLAVLVAPSFRNICVISQQLKQIQRTANSRYQSQKH